TQNRSQWDLPFRVQVARFVMGSRAAGMSVARQLSDPAQAESLLAKGTRAGAGYRFEVSAESDSVMFAKAMRAGPGNVIGPDSVSVGWEVVRVLAVQPSRPRTFQECRILVEQRWYGVEGERLMVELLARSRRQTRVVVNEKAVNRLTSS
ncbi:MAG: peptidylprolyl isomerase, partial [Candidatus Eisenbacteria bacterium]